MRVGLISDTHGLLRPEVIDALQGVALILHAGDVGDSAVLAELEMIAPVKAVWGNTDGWDLRRLLSEVVDVELEGRKVTVTHGHQLGSPTPRAIASRYPDAELVVFGHSHQPVIERVGSVLAVNPGSAGPARFNLPITVAIAMLTKDLIEARLVTLKRR
jgi:putative phosphoesterase